MYHLRRAISIETALITGQIYRSALSIERHEGMISQTLESVLRWKEGKMTEKATTVVPHLELRHITKRFPGIIANQDVNLKINHGEVHALLGENGAGKSTLMNVLVGLYTAEEGDILIDGKKANIRTPKDSIALGIGMVHQHFKLVEELTVAENIIIGYEKQGFKIDLKKVENDLRELSDKYNLPISPELRVSDLSAGEKQRVEIVKMLYRNVDLLILDEPTSVLTPQETERLFDNLREMKAQNKTIIFISHKLDEVMEIADRVTILRGGKLIETMDKTDTDPQDLARKMIGREMVPASRGFDNDLDGAPEMFVADHITAKGDEGAIAVDDVSLSIRAGEILGIAGVSGNGQTELAEVLTGLRGMEKGTLMVDGKPVKNNVKAIIDAGVGHIPEDRNGTGAVPNFSVLENVALKKYNKAPIKKGIVMDRNAMREFGEKLLSEFDVRMSSSDMPARLLSGGNMQKMICAREIDNNPKVIVAVHPTYGLDVAAIDMVHRYLIEEQKKGCAILLISESLDEVFALSDTIAVMFHHKLTSKRNREDWTIDSIGFAMMGISDEQRAAAEARAAVSDAVTEVPEEKEGGAA